MRVLVTGGAGFIGSHISQRLLEDGHEVRILDNLSTGRIENIERFRDNITFLEGDIRDELALKTSAQGCDLIYHQAAIVSVPYSVDHPEETMDVNIGGTLNVIRSASRHGVKRVVFASSAAVYGDAPELPKEESMIPVPISPYGAEKIMGEYYAKMATRLYGVECVALRYFNVFGPRQDPRSPYSGVISVFVDRVLSRKSPTVFGDGHQYRDFVFIDNVVQANMLAGTSDKAPGEAYNVGLGQKTSLLDLLSALQEITGFSFDPAFAKPREGDIRESVAKITKIETELGYKPTVGVKEGLRRLCDYERGLREGLNEVSC